MMPILQLFQMKSLIIDREVDEMLLELIKRKNNLY